MEAIQASSGESRPVTRERSGVAWCPFCDRSRQVVTTGPICEGCGVEFVDTVADDTSINLIEEPVAIEEPEEEVVEEPVAEEESPRRRNNK